MTRISAEKSKVYLIFQPKSDIIYLKQKLCLKGECRMKSSKQIAEEWGLSRKLQ